MINDNIDFCIIYFVNINIWNDFVEYILEKYSITILIASFAFLGAIIAQIVSHCFALKRENIKYRKEIYQELFAPKLYKALLYLKIRTWYHGHDLNCSDEDINNLKEDIIKHIGDHIGYANPNLILKYNEVISHDYFDDASAFYHKVDELLLFNEFLIEMINLNKKIKLIDRDTKNEIIKTIIKYYCCSIFSIARCSIDDGLRLASLLFYFDKFKYGYFSQRFLRRQLNIQFESHEDFIAHFINYITKNYISSKDKRNSFIEAINDEINILNKEYKIKHEGA